MASYTFMLDPRSYPGAEAGAALLRIRSDTWVPAEVDPAQIDRRAGRAVWRAARRGVVFRGNTFAK